MARLPNQSALLLLVDDNEDERFMAEYAHQQSGLPNKLVMFPGGEGIVEAVKTKTANGQEPGLLLLDINMPGIDGFACLERIRADPDIGEILPVVMLTNSDSPDDMQRAADLGADGYQVKPTGLDPYVVFFNSLAA